MKEELNIDAALEEKIRLKPSSETAWEHVVVYFCETDLKPIPNSSEIIDGSFRHLVDISNEIMVKPDIFTSTFKKIFTTIF